MRLVEQRLRLHHLGLRRGVVGRALVKRGLRDVLIADELLAALQLERGVDRRRLCLGEIGALLLDRRLVGGLLEPEQEIAGLDLLPFGEISLLDEARDPRDDVDLVDRRHAPEELAGFRHLAARHGDHRDRRRRRSTLGHGRATADEQGQRTNGGRPTETRVATRHQGSPDSRETPPCIISPSDVTGWLMWTGTAEPERANACVTRQSA